MMRAIVLAASLALCAQAMAQTPDSSAPAVSAPAISEPRVTMHTSLGNIVVELDTQHAPRTAANFMRYVRAGYYDNIRIYRVEPGFLIQMGDMTADGKLKTPLYRPIPLETATSAHHERGTLGLAHKSIDSSSGDTSFYIDLAENSDLNAKAHAKPNTTGDTVFGRVIAGMEVIDQMEHVRLLPKKAGGLFPGATPRTPIIIKKMVLSGG